MSLFIETSRIITDYGLGFQSNTVFVILFVSGKTIKWVENELNISDDAFLLRNKLIYKLAKTDISGPF